MENSSKIGGPGDIIKIDKSASGGRKYNRGRLTKTRWVLGGICRRTKKCFLKVVDKRDANTLHSVILDNVEPGTTIVTDMWHGYNSLEQYGYTHLSVNHSLNFVCPRNSAVHTQTIESHWSKIKRDMRRRVGRMSVSTFQTYLIEYVWRNMCFSAEELFNNF